MNFLQEAARLNNEGALLLSSGNARRPPLKYFKTGLQWLQQGCSQCVQPKESSSLYSSSRPLASLRKAVQVPVVNDPKRYYSQRNAAQCTRNCPSAAQEYIYRPAFVFQVEGEMTVEKQSLASAVLLFNYALGLHQRGVDEGVLDRALYLYNQSLYLLSHLTEFVDCNEMIAAILSSKADIYYRLNDYQSVRAVLDELFLMTHNLAIANEIAKKSSSQEDIIAPCA